jgi:hypothetical protein
MARSLPEQSSQPSEIGDVGVGGCEAADEFFAFDEYYFETDNGRDGEVWRSS